MKGKEVRDHTYGETVSKPHGKFTITTPYPRENSDYQTDMPKEPSKEPGDLTHSIKPGTAQ